jgi:hypothetical protein
MTSGSPDIVELEKNGSVKKVHEAEGVILDVTMNFDTNRIKTMPPSKSYRFSTKVEDTIFGYRIYLDPTGNPIDINFIPKGIKE